MPQEQGPPTPNLRKFYGTGLEAQHVGETAARVLAVLTEPGVGMPVTVQGQGGSEDSDVIPVVVSASGADLKARPNTSVEIELLDTSLVPLASTAFTATVGTRGSAISTDAKARLAAQTDADGFLDLDITDVAGASGATVFIRLTALTGLGNITYTSVTFD